MKKIFCDICGKEIIKSNETWTNELRANDGNKRVSYDEKIEDICESCATTIHCCIRMMKHCKWEPDFHEVLGSDDVFESDKAGYQLSELKELYEK